MANTKPSKRVTPFSAHCISDHRVSDQKVRTAMVRARVRVRVRVGDAVRNAVGRKVGNRLKVFTNTTSSGDTYHTARTISSKRNLVQIYVDNKHFIKIHLES